MSEQGTIKWESETGAINLTGSGKEERVIILSRDFVEEFIKELINTSGESTFRMTLRKLLEKLAKAAGKDAEITWNDFEKLNDEQILPVSPEGTPPEFKWDGKTRELVLLPDLKMAMWTVSSFHAFKDALTDIMTDKGASAMINGAGKKAGMAVAAQLAKYHGWSDLQKAVDALAETTSKMNALTGWGKASGAHKKGADGKEMILLKVENSYEAVGKKASAPGCTITSSFLNGTWNGFADILGGAAAEAREVTCTAKGDAHCAFAIKIKDKGAPALDWKELAAEWQAI